MLRRPPTQLSLTRDDLAVYTANRTARLQREAQETAESQARAQRLNHHSNNKNGRRQSPDISEFRERLTHHRGNIRAEERRRKGKERAATNAGSEGGVECEEDVFMRAPGEEDGDGSPSLPGARRGGTRGAGGGGAARSQNVNPSLASSSAVEGTGMVGAPRLQHATLATTKSAGAYTMAAADAGLHMPGGGGVDSGSATEEASRSPSLGSAISDGVDGIVHEDEDNDNNDDERDLDASIPSASDHRLSYDSNDTDDDAENDPHVLEDEDGNDEIQIIHEDAEVDDGDGMDLDLDHGSHPTQHRTNLGYDGALDDDDDVQPSQNHAENQTHNAPRRQRMGLGVRPNLPPAPAPLHAPARARQRAHQTTGNRAGQARRHAHDGDVDEAEDDDGEAEEDDDDDDDDEAEDSMLARRVRLQPPHNRSRGGLGRGGLGAGESRMHAQITSRSDAQPQPQSQQSQHSQQRRQINAPDNHRLQLQPQAETDATLAAAATATAERERARRERARARVMGASNSSSGNAGALGGGAVRSGANAGAGLGIGGARMGVPPRRMGGGGGR